MSAAASLRAVLDAQREAACRGDLASLARLPGRLDRAAGRLDPATPDLAALRAEAARTAEILAAALRGLREAQAILAARRAPPAFATYDRSGRLQRSAAPARDLAR